MPYVLTSKQSVGLLIAQPVCRCTETKDTIMHASRLISNTIELKFDTAFLLKLTSAHVTIQHSNDGVCIFALKMVNTFIL